MGLVLVGSASALTPVERDGDELGSKKFDALSEADLDPYLASSGALSSQGKGPAPRPSVAIDDYLASFAQAHSGSGTLKTINSVLCVDREFKWIDTAWLGTAKAGPALNDALDALEDRVRVARLGRPVAFQPPEIRRRLRELLMRLHPAHFASLGPVSGDGEAVSTTYGYTRYGTGVGYGRGGGTSYTTNAGTTSATGSGGWSRPVSPGYTNGSSTGRRRSSRTTARNTSTVGTSSTATSSTSSSRNGSVTWKPPVQSQGTWQNSRPVATPFNTARVERRLPVSSPPVGPVSRPPTVTPPALPPVQTVKVEQRSSSTFWLVALLAVLIPGILAAFIAWRRRGEQAAPAPTAGKAISLLLDPEHRNLDAAGMAGVGRKAAKEEDWLKAMRYLFASLLTQLALARGAQIHEFHTNREITSLVSADNRTGESFWSAATVFEVFWYGQRKPMESDFRLFETLVNDCLAAAGGGRA